MALKQIDPLTTATLRITVKDGDEVLVTDAVTTADVVAPSGKTIADDVALANTGAGVYTLTILPAWSDDGNGGAVRGVFTALITVTRFGQQRTRQFQYLVDYIQ